MEKRAGTKDEPWDWWKGRGWCFEAYKMELFWKKVGDTRVLVVNGMFGFVGGSSGRVARNASLWEDRPTWDHQYYWRAGILRRDLSVSPTWKVCRVSCIFCPRLRRDLPANNGQGLQDSRGNRGCQAGRSPLVKLSRGSWVVSSRKNRER